MTCMVMDKHFIYSFGGAAQDFHQGVDNNRGFEVERLDTTKLDQGWIFHKIKCDYLRCCQQGVIPLNTSWANEELGKQGERRYIVFGGVYEEFIDQVFMFNENTLDLS